MKYTVKITEMNRDMLQIDIRGEVTLNTHIVRRKEVIQALYEALKKYYEEKL